MTNKNRTSIPQKNKIRAELQREIGSRCPFCGNTDVGHFEIHHMDENPANNETGNLILLCPTCHSKITKGDISPIEVLQKKIECLSTTEKAKKHDKSEIQFNAPVGNAITGDNAKITINQKSKKIVNKNASGTIGSDSLKADYIGHLVDRYNTYKKSEMKERMSYGAAGAILKRKFKVPKTRRLYDLPLSKFGELIIEIQNMIDRTRLARQKGRHHKNYSSFDEYCEKYR